MEKTLNIYPYFYRKKHSFGRVGSFSMIHQNKCFVCPGQSYGISWNICLGRQGRGFKGCQDCTYKDWQNKGEISLNPYLRAFVEGDELVDIEDEKYRYPDPQKVPIYSAEPRKFLPSDIGLEESKPKPKRRSWIQRLYDAI